MRLIKGLLPTLLVLLGMAAIAAGVWLIYRPAGIITGGVLLSVLGLILIRGRSEDDETAD